MAASLQALFGEPVDSEKTHDELKSRLHKEIAALKKALALVDRDRTRSVDIIDKHTRDVMDVLHIIIDKKLDTRKQQNQPGTTMTQCLNPIHDLLFVGPLNRVEIPVDVIEMMITAGFDMNDAAEDVDKQTCLYRAISNCHYNVVRLLVKKRAISQGYLWVGIYSVDYELDARTPIILLASHQNVPLDLFDLLATQHNTTAALRTTISSSCSENALHLIKLGARLDTMDESSKLPVNYFLENKKITLNVELFMHLLPSRAHGVHILKTISEILLFKIQYYRKNKVILEMIHQFIQRLTFIQPLHVSVDIQFPMFRLTLNDDAIDIFMQHRKSTFVVYLCSLILVEMQFDMLPATCNMGQRLDPYARPHLLCYAHALDELWKTSSQKYNVKSLLRLCILQTRASMNNLDDNSFLSLPIPSSIRKMLTYRDVSERIYEDWCQGLNKSQ